MTTAMTLTVVPDYIGRDLDEFAVSLADLASAVERRDVAEVAAHLYDLGLHDLDLSAALGDFLSFAGLFDQEVTR